MVGAPCSDHLAMGAQQGMFGTTRMVVSLCCTCDGTPTIRCHDKVFEPQWHCCKRWVARLNTLAHV